MKLHKERANQHKYVWIVKKKLTPQIYHNNVQEDERESGGGSTRSGAPLRWRRRRRSGIVRGGARRSRGSVKVDLQFLAQRTVVAKRANKELLGGRI